MDAEARVIVAYGLDANASDQHQLTPIVDAVEANMGRKPDEVSAEAGYCSSGFSFTSARVRSLRRAAFLAPSRSV